jgi:nucleotide-binding universal stress UspA family protein
VVIAAVIVSGACIGINNTLTTQAVMLVSPVDRPIASSAYGFVRFIGGGLAPFVAGKLADATSLAVPFYLGGGTFLLGIVVLATGHRLLTAAESHPGTAAVAPRLERVSTEPVSRRPVIAAVGATADADDVVAAAAALARDRGTSVDVVRVRETVVIEELAVDPEPEEEAREAVVRHLEALHERHVPATGQLLHSVGDHAAAARALAQHAQEVEASAVVIGQSPHGRLVQFSAGSFTRTLTAAAACPVLLVGDEDEPVRLDAEALAKRAADLR